MVNRWTGHAHISSVGSYFIDDRVELAAHVDVAVLLAFAHHLDDARRDAVESHVLVAHGHARHHVVVERLLLLLLMITVHSLVAALVAAELIVVALATIRRRVRVELLVEVVVVGLLAIAAVAQVPHQVALPVVTVDGRGDEWHTATVAAVAVAAAAAALVAHSV